MDRKRNLDNSPALNGVRDLMCAASCKTQGVNGQMEQEGYGPGPVASESTD
jgi:hypothetical protein